MQHSRERLEEAIDWICTVMCGVFTHTVWWDDSQSKPAVNTLQSPVNRCPDIAEHILCNWFCAEHGVPM